MGSFADNQPQGFRNYVENVAIVGIGGRSGAFMADALIKGGKHRVTAITRADSSNKMPSGVHDVKKVDYNNHESLVQSLVGQDVLIITMAVLAPPDSQKKLIDAAVEAEVRWIMPNEWGYDPSNTKMGNDSMIGPRLIAARKHIEEVGVNKTNWIGLCCGFWYEFSLAGTEARYGFDFDKKTLTLYDEGETKINTSTWPLVGIAVAKLLSLKILPDNEHDTAPCLSQWTNRSANISSFFVNQKEMFESVLRVTGDKREDWTVTHENVVERFNRGHRLLKEGKMVGFGILLYARIFYKDGAGDYRAKVDNEKLGLPKEDLDAATKVAIGMAERGENNAIG